MPVPALTTYRIYEAICEYLREDIHPTYREIAARCHMAPSSVLRHIDRLEGMGWIRREESKMRSIRLGSEAPGLNPVPFDEKKKKRR
jgi:DNA-binding Lrp family transcriptional regulator